MDFQKQIIQLIAQEFEKLPDSRAQERLEYTMSDITLFGIKKTPSDNHIRDTLDDIKVEKLQPVFDVCRIHSQNPYKIYRLLLKKNTLDKYTYFDNKTLLVLLDGTYYHSSEKIHCSHCQTRKKADSKGAETIQYYHSAITPIIARPNTNTILPLLREIISNTDGNDKQDCEINGSKRRVSLLTNCSDNSTHKWYYRKITYYCTKV
jgi:hypothetical protein